LTNEINRETPIPLYYQVSQILRKEIESGRYSSGDYIPTEFELQKRFNVSRATVRQALSDLVYQGLLERRRSKGTVVSRMQVEATLKNLVSFTNEMMNGKQELTTRILDFRYIPPPNFVAEQLGIPEYEMVVEMARLRVVDGTPVAVERWYAPLKLFPGISRAMFKETGMEQSTYVVLMKQYDVNVARAVDTVSAVAVGAVEAKLLNEEIGAPVLLRTRVSYTADNRPVTYATGVYVIKLRFPLEATRNNNQS